MNKKYYVILISGLLLFSCSTDPTDDQNPLYNKLVGTWDRYNYYPNQDFNYGNLTFRSNNTFTDSIHRQNYETSTTALNRIVSGKYYLEDDIIIFSEFEFVYFDTNSNISIVTYNPKNVKINFVENDILRLDFAQIFEKKTGTSDNIIGEWERRFWICSFENNYPPHFFKGEAIETRTFFADSAYSNFKKHQYLIEYSFDSSYFKDYTYEDPYVYNPSILQFDASLYVYECHIKNKKMYLYLSTYTPNYYKKRIN